MLSSPCYQINQEIVKMFEYTCAMCDGTGRQPTSEIPSERCRACNSTGWIIPKDQEETRRCEVGFSIGRLQRRPIQR